MAPSDFNFRTLELESTKIQQSFTTEEIADIFIDFEQQPDVEQEQQEPIMTEDIADVLIDFQPQQDFDPVHNNYWSDNYLSDEALDSLLDFPDEDDTDNWISPLASGHITQRYNYYSDDVLNDWPY